MRLEELLVYVLERPKMSGFNDLQGDDARCFRSCQQHIWLENISAVAIGGKHGIVGLNVGGAGVLVVNTNQLGAREPHGPPLLAQEDGQAWPGSVRVVTHLCRAAPTVACTS